MAWCNFVKLFICQHHPHELGGARDRWLRNRYLGTVPVAFGPFPWRGIPRGPPEITDVIKLDGPYSNEARHFDLRERLDPLQASRQSENPCIQIEGTSNWASEATRWSEIYKSYRLNIDDCISFILYPLQYTSLQPSIKAQSKSYELSTTISGKPLRPLPFVRVCKTSWWKH